MRTRTARDRWLANMLAVIMIIGCSMFVQRAHAAQSRSANTVPGPLSTRDLERYGDTLGMSDQQRIAVHPFHDDYLQRFARLRQQRIDALVADMPNLRNIVGRGISPARGEYASRELKNVLSRIDQLEDSLFSEIETVLSDAQINRMLQVRLKRQRERDLIIIGYLAPSTQPAALVDLTEVIASLDLAMVEFADLAPVISEYQWRYSNRVRTLQQTIVDQYIGFRQQLEREGLTADAIRDRQTRDQLILVTTVYSVAMHSTIAAAAFESTKVNRAALRDMMATLPPDIARALFHAFCRAGYGGMIAESVQTDQMLYEMAARSLLDDKQRASVMQIIHGLHAVRPAVLEQILDATDQQYRSGMYLLRSRVRSDAPEIQRINALRQRASQLNRQAREAAQMYLASLPVDAAARAAAPSPQPNHDTWGEPVVQYHRRPLNNEDVYRRYHITDLAAAPRWDAPHEQRDAFIVNPITAEEVDAWQTLMQLSDQQTALLASLHSDYQRKYEEQVHTPFVTPLVEGQIGRWRMAGENNRLQGPSMEAIEERYQLRQGGMNAVLALDAAFFEDVQLLLQPQRSALLDLWRATRRRALYSAAESQYAALIQQMETARQLGMSDRQWQIDLVSLLRHVDSAHENQPHLVTTPEQLRRLVAYQTSAAGLTKRIADTALATMKIRDQMASQTARDEESVRRQMQSFSESSGRIANAAQQLAELNAATITQMAQHLEQKARDALHHAYTRAAFPQIYEGDADALHALLRDALALDDLTGVQRTALQNMLVDYREAYGAKCDEIVDTLQAYQQEVSGLDRRALPPILQRYRAAMDQLQFERSELNDKMRQRVRALLDDSQAERLGGLQPAA